MSRKMDELVMGVGVLCIVGLLVGVLFTACATAGAKGEIPEDPCQPTGHEDLMRCPFPDDNVVIFTRRRGVAAAQQGCE